MIPGVKISPAILSADFLHLEDQTAQALGAGCEYVHMDILDGKFAADISFGPRIVAALAPMIHRAGAGVDVHLMVEEPERLVPRFVLAGADIVTIHVEASKDVRIRAWRACAASVNCWTKCIPPRTWRSKEG